MSNACIGLPTLIESLLSLRSFQQFTLVDSLLETWDSSHTTWAAKIIWSLRYNSGQLLMHENWSWLTATDAWYSITTIWKLKRIYSLNWDTYIVRIFIITFLRTTTTSNNCSRWLVLIHLGYLFYVHSPRIMSVMFADNSQHPLHVLDLIWLFNVRLLIWQVHL